MAKLTYFSMAVLTLLLAVVVGFGALGIAVREQKIDEVMLWLPPTGRYQLIVRVGADALPWARQPNATAINIWVHGRGTDWHVMHILRVPMGE